MTKKTWIAMLFVSVGLIASQSSAMAWGGRGAGFGWRGPAVAWRGPVVRAPIYAPAPYATGYYGAAPVYAPYRAPIFRPAYRAPFARRGRW